MVQLAPHLVYPTPFLVPRSARQRSRSHRDRAEHVRRDGDHRGSGASRPRARRAHRRAARTTGRPTATARSPATRWSSWSRRSPRATPREAYLFYDCQTDDVRLVLTVLGEAERFGAVCRERRRGESSCSTDGGRAAGVACARRRDRRALRGRGRQRRQRDRRLGRPHPARGAPRRGGGAADPPEPRHPRHRLDRTTCRSTRPALHRPGRRGAHDLRAALARAHADRHDRQRLRRATSTTSQPADDDVDYLLEAVNAFFGIDLGPRRPHRRLRRRAAADLDRRPEEVGRHLAQGRAVRDLLGACSRSPAASSPPGGGWRSRPSTGWSSARAARRPAAPHEIPLGMAGERGRPRPARRAREDDARRLPRAARLPLRARGARRARARRRAPRAGAADRRRACPTCSPRRSIAARLEQARSVADVLLRRTRLGLLAAPQLRTRRVGGAPVAEAIGARARLGRRPRSRAEARALARGRGGRGHRPGTRLERSERLPVRPELPLRCRDRWPTELNDLHLADLHERAAEAGISGYRLLRREELIEQLGSEPSEPSERPRRRGRRGGRRSAREPATRRPRAEASDAAAADESDADADTDELVVRRGEGPRRLRRAASRRRDEDLPTEDVAGVLELTRQRYGFLRLEGLAPAEATSTSPPPRSAAASCAPATRSPGRRASRAAASATARSSTSTASTARSRSPSRASSSTR